MDAFERAPLITVWHILQSAESHSKSGIDFYAKRCPEQAKRRAIDGFRNVSDLVTFAPTAA
jgi:hypothetical protein